MLGSNLRSFFSGGTRGSELRQTRYAWDEAQAYWRASPLAKSDASDFALALVQEAVASAGRAPAAPIVVAVCEAVETLYRAENIAALEAQWPVIESSIEAAIEFRQMLPRRKRWAVDFPTMHGAFKRIVLDTLFSFFDSLPESCFGDWDTARNDTFETPLIDLLDDPAKAVDVLFRLPYDEASFRLDIFYRLRDLCASNLLVASGFLPTDNIHEREHKIVWPLHQKKKTGAELAELYLNGSPLKALLDIPVPFRIPDELRYEHCHIVGGTGHGKTQLMQKMIHADLLASQEDERSVIVIDSQGDLINKLTRLDIFSPYKSGSLSDRLIVIDPSDVEWPAALNLFDAHLDRVKSYSAADRERVLNGVIELYEMFFGAFLGAELTQKQGVIFKYLARLMLAIPDATIYTLMKIMEDGKPFKRYMDELDGSARYFFETEFFHPSFAATKKQVLRRLWGVLSTPAFERMFTQPKNKVDLFEAMNDGKIILVNTAKDLLKREGSQLLGRFFIAMITQAALERSTIPEYRRRSVFVYVDEAQEYFDDSIETILNQARKYRVGLTLAHQTLDQLSPKLRSAILTNTSMKCVGGVSAKDARALSDELRTTPEFIEGMKRRGPRSEFAVWVKHLTGQAIRLSVPLGFLESQPTLDADELETLVVFNRIHYCGSKAEMPAYEPSGLDEAAAKPAGEASAEPKPPPPEARTNAKTSAPPETHSEENKVARPKRDEPSGDPGKGGKDHRYLQALVKQLAEQCGLRAVIEAPLQNGAGQVDVLLEREGVVAVIEISVSTPVDYEKRNLRKCLDAGYPRVGVVLAKSKRTQANYRAVLSDGLTPQELARVSFLAPEDLPEFIASVAPPPQATEKVVKGYRVKVSESMLTPEEVRARRDALARVIARSMAEKGP